jgi:hypothetical protein
MLSVQMIAVSCSRCRQIGQARWLEDTTKPGTPRKLVALSEGFCSIDRGRNAEPEVSCMRCNDTHLARREARSALPPAVLSGHHPEI